MYCNKCGKENYESSQFCDDCGNSLGSTNYTRTSAPNYNDKRKVRRWRMPIIILVVVASIYGLFIHKLEMDIKDSDVKFEARIITPGIPNSKEILCFYTKTEIKHLEFKIVYTMKDTGETRSQIIREPKPTINAWNMLLFGNGVEYISISTYYVTDFKGKKKGNLTQKIFN